MAASDEIKGTVSRGSRRRVAERGPEYRWRCGRGFPIDPPVAEAVGPDRR
jgi:hypothetical protein